MPLVLKELASSDATNRRNAAFCVGELCRNGGEVALKYPSVPFVIASSLKSLFPGVLIFEYSLPPDDNICHYDNDCYRSQIGWTLSKLCLTCSSSLCFSFHLY